MARLLVLPVPVPVTLSLSHPHTTRSSHVIPSQLVRQPQQRPRPRERRRPQPAPLVHLRRRQRRPISGPRLSTRLDRRSSPETVSRRNSRRRWSCPHPRRRRRYHPRRSRQLACPGPSGHRVCPRCPQEVRRHSLSPLLPTMDPDPTTGAHIPGSSSSSWASRASARRPSSPASCASFALTRANVDKRTWKLTVDAVARAGQVRHVRQHVPGDHWCVSPPPPSLARPSQH